MSNRASLHVSVGGLGRLLIAQFKIQTDHTFLPLIRMHHRRKEIDAFGKDLHILVGLNRHLALKHKLYFLNLLGAYEHLTKSDDSRRRVLLSC